MQQYYILSKEKYNENVLKINIDEKMIALSVVF